jgi:hypothetical protein
MARWNFFLETPGLLPFLEDLMRRASAPAPLDVLLERYPHERCDDASAGDKRATERA